MYELLDANYRHGGQSRSFAQVPRTDGATRGRPTTGRLLHFGAARGAVIRDQVVIANRSLVSSV